MGILLTICTCTLSLVTSQFILGPAYGASVLRYSRLITRTEAYTYFHYCSNWGMLKKDMPPIQLYIDHFETLQPVLLSIYSENMINMLSSPNGLFSLHFWPHVTTRWSTEPSSNATDLFVRLEAAGWSRRVLYEFLRDTVEQGGVVSQLEKEAFAAVMEKVTRHSLTSWYTNTADRYHWFMTRWARRPVRELGSIERPLEMQTVHVDLDSVDWILQRGVLLVPQNPRTLECLKVLGFLARVEKVEELNTNFRQGRFWQLVMAG